MSSDTELFAPPVIIGALGGSGTRVVTRILRDAGWWMGGKLSASSEDSLPVRSFLAKWFDRLLVGDASAEMIENARADFSDAIAEHRQGIAHEAAPWGWKNPRNMWLMEFFAASYPRIKFVHMLRDGRDMSYSNNAYFLRQYGDRLYPGWRKNARVAQMEIWGIGNRRAASAARDLPGPLQQTGRGNRGAITIRRRAKRGCRGFRQTGSAVFRYRTLARDGATAIERTVEGGARAVRLSID
jgi:hypothetical protein